MNLKKTIPEAYLIAAATSSSESDVETDGMCGWSASECKDYKVGIATVARACVRVHQYTKGYVGMAWTLLSSSECIDSYEDVYLHLLGRKTSGKASPYSLNELPM